MSTEEYGWAEERPQVIDQAINRLLDGGWTLPSRLRQPPEQGQLLPVNIFENPLELVIVAPMPGMEPENIDVSISGHVLTMRGQLRGPRQTERRYLRNEWTYGPYYRAVELPFPVDADRANASFDNGVLTISLPKSAEFRGRRIELKQIGHARGQAFGHSGQAGH